MCTHSSVDTASHTGHCLINEELAVNSTEY